MNELTFKGNWNELKGKIKQTWGNLTDDDLTVAEGKMDNLIGNIQKRTGESVDVIRQKLTQLQGVSGAYSNRNPDGNPGHPTSGNVENRATGNATGTTDENTDEDSDRSNFRSEEGDSAEKA